LKAREVAFEGFKYVPAAARCDRGAVPCDVGLPSCQDSETTLPTAISVQGGR